MTAWRDQKTPIHFIDVGERAPQAECLVPRFVDEGDVPRAFGLAEVFGAPAVEGLPELVAGRDARRGDDEGNRHLVADVVGGADDRDVGHVGVSREQVLDMAKPE